MKKTSLLIFFILLIITASVVLVFFLPKNEKTKKEIENNSKEILYFYSDTCHWCQKQKPIIQELEKEGIKFRWMNIGQDRNLITQYNIEGTPTFILGDKRMVGFRSKDQIRKFWEENKK